MRPSTVLSRWLFEELAGTFVEGATLYVPRSAVEDGGIVIDGEVDENTQTVEVYSITGGRVFPLASKNDIEGAYMVYDSIEVMYESTKDGREPSGISFRILAVDCTYDGVEALADAIEAAMEGATVPELGDVEIYTRRSDFTPERGDYIVEFKLSISL